MLLSQAQDRPLSFTDRLRLRTHFAICKRCQHVSRQLEFLRVAVQHYRDGN